MARYTRADLEKLITRINAKLRKGNSPYYLMAEARNGYIGIDLYKDHACKHCVGTGNPREAAAVAMDWVISNAVAIETE